jgi:hypothetical protein
MTIVQNKGGSRMYFRRTEKKKKTDSQKAKISRQNVRPSNSTRHLLAAIADPGGASPADVLELQKKLGNQTTVGVLGAEKPLSDRFNSAVQAARGTGEKMPPSLREQAGRGLHFDFSGVRLHTGEQADTLSRQIGAKAFTVGSDIFFTHGAFSPSSPDGQRILRHELTHVVQQKGQSAAHLHLGARNNDHEREAQRVSQGSCPASLGSAPAGSVQRTGRLGLDIPEDTQPLTDPGSTIENFPMVDSANTVIPLVHSGEGMKPDGFFKPNNMDEDQPSTMAARAVGSSRLDQWLGLGTHSNDQFADYRAHGEGLIGSESQTVNGVHANQVPVDTFKGATTQRGLSNLQLVDAISGQRDRKDENTMIGGGGDVTGIDHDISFGSSGQKKLTELEGSYNHPDAAKIVGSPLTGTFDKYAGLPSHVDAGAAASILRHKGGDLGRVLNNSQSEQKLSPQEVQEAQARYKIVKRYVKKGIAGTDNAGERLNGMQISPDKATKWRGKYANMGIAGPKIVDQWNDQTFQDQMRETGEIVNAPRARQVPGMSSFAQQAANRSYLQRIVRSRTPFQGAAHGQTRDHTGLLGGNTHSGGTLPPVPAQNNQAPALPVNPVNQPPARSRFAKVPGMKKLKGLLDKFRN